MNYIHLLANTKFIKKYTINTINTINFINVVNITTRQHVAFTRGYRIAKQKKEYSFSSLPRGVMENYKYDGGSRIGNVKLNKTQLEILQYAMNGRNVFFTGSAGTGKSFLLHGIIQALRDQGKKVAVTASTGIASEHIGGTTLHTFAGIGVPTLKSDFNRMLAEDIAKRWKEADVLIIDEISMVSGDLLDCLESTVSKIRTPQNEECKPFGGIQLIFCGDFFQIPPVNKQQSGLNKRRIEALRKADPSQIFHNSGHCFSAKIWNHCFPTNSKFELNQVFRQGDPSFINILNELRRGLLTPESINLLKGCRRPLNTDDGIEPTQLYSRNKGVLYINDTKLDDLKGDECSFRAVDRVVVSGWNDIIYLNKETPVEENIDRDNVFDIAWKELDLLRSERNAQSISTQTNILQSDLFWLHCQAIPEIKLKLGAQVMLLKNLDLGSSDMLVNGSRGVIIRFETDIAKILIELVSDLQKLKKKKSKSARYESLDIRCKIESILSQNPDTKIPVVRFVNGREEYILPEYFTSEISGIGRCVRYQLPLKLAWAMTIHKCQGLTLDKASISLSGVFASGQAYVALSRVRSIDSMQLKAFSQGSLIVDPEVCRFYRENFPTNPSYEPFDGLYGKDESQEGWVM